MKVQLFAEASGKTPVGGSFTAMGQSAAYTPVAGRSINYSAWGTFVGTLRLERSFDAGVTWLPVTALGTGISFTAPFSETWDEAEANVQYRLNCSAYTSGTANYRISQ